MSSAIELKNVAELMTEHVNQLHRYLDDEDMGRFGVHVTRTPPPKNVQTDIVDLHSSKRAAILCLDHIDLELMASRRCARSTSSSPADCQVGEPCAAETPSPTPPAPHN